MLKINGKQTSLLSSSGRSGTSIAGEIVEEESTSSGDIRQQAGEKTLPELDTRTRLVQLYGECKTFRMTFVVQRTCLYNLSLACQVHDQHPPIYDF